MKNPVLHPLLLAVFPILFLYSQNINQTSFAQALWPLVYSVLAAVLLWLLLFPLMRNFAAAGLAASFLLALFFSYGRLYAVLDNWGIFVPGHAHFLPVFLLAGGYAVYFIKIARSDFKNTTRVLNVIAGALVLINLFNIGSYQIMKPGLPPGNELNTEGVFAAEAASGETAARPDIYLIILDEYANPDTMKRYYDYDNSEFVSRLEDKGFYIAHDSRMYNRETVRAVASILNMDYTPETEPNEISYLRIVDNAVVDYLRSRGYRYTYFGHWYELERYEMQADSYFNFYATENRAFISEFSATLWNTTMLRPFYYYLTAEQYEGYYREGLIHTLEQLKKTPEMEGPQFVFAHLLCPHPPYVFGPDGERLAPSDFFNFEDDELYVGQYVFISQEIERVIEEILGQSAVEPIIIVQSDHGPRWTGDWERIFNAYYLPGDGKDLLSASISPVNTFRLIFNHYFQADYALLEDR